MRWAAVAICSLALIIGSAAPTFIAEISHPGALWWVPATSRSDLSARHQLAAPSEPQHAANSIALPVTIIPSADDEAKVTAQKRRDDEHAAAEDALARSTEKLAWFTLVLAAGTFGLVGIGFWHGRHLERSVAAANRLADATQQNVDLIPDIERAYLSAGGMRIAPARFRFNVSNHGKTKATLIRAHWRFFDEDDIQGQLPAMVVRPYDDLIAPQQLDRGILPIEIPREVRDIANLTIHGQIDYTDIWSREFLSMFVLNIGTIEERQGPVDAPANMTRRT